MRLLLFFLLASHALVVSAFGAGSASEPLSCHIEYFNTNEPEKVIGYCSAVPVSESRFITAAHCFVEHSVMKLGKRLVCPGFSAQPIAQALTYPGHYASSGFDIAAFETAAPLTGVQYFEIDLDGNTPKKIRCTTDCLCESVHTTYQKLNDGKLEFKTERRPITQAETDFFDWNNLRQNQEDLSIRENRPTSGDSGSGIFCKDSKTGKFKLNAIVTQASESTQEARALLTSTTADWIRYATQEKLSQNNDLFLARRQLTVVCQHALECRKLLASQTLTLSQDLARIAQHIEVNDRLVQKVPESGFETSLQKINHLEQSLRDWIVRCQSLTQ